MYSVSIFIHTKSNVVLSDKTNHCFSNKLQKVETFIPACNNIFASQYWETLGKHARSCKNCGLKCMWMSASRPPGGGYSQKKWVGVCGPLSKTLTPFMTKICDFPYPIYDLTKNLIPYVSVLLHNYFASSGQSTRDNGNFYLLLLGRLLLVISFL